MPNERCPTRRSSLFDMRKPKPAQPEESVIVRAVSQLFEEATDEQALQRLGTMLKADELVTRDDKRKLRRVYADCLRAMKVVYDGKVDEGG